MQNKISLLKYHRPKMSDRYTPAFIRAKCNPKTMFEFNMKTFNPRTEKYEYYVRMYSPWGAIT